jgi:hypothetical protein
VLKSGEKKRATKGAIFESAKNEKNRIGLSPRKVKLQTVKPMMVKKITRHFIQNCRAIFKSVNVLIPTAFLSAG